MLKQPTPNPKCVHDERNLSTRLFSPFFRVSLFVYLFYLILGLKTKNKELTLIK